MKQILSLPHPAQRVIEEFLNLPLGGKVIPCPYHINIRRERVGLRVLVGKGDPGEIVKEVKVWAKLKDFDLDKATVSQIRKFMIDRSIGIDCSGLIVHTVGYLLKESGKNKLISYLKFSKNDLLSILRRILRPVENISANTLSNFDNCDPITDMNKIQPGDFIRSKGKMSNSHHIHLITRVFKEDGFVTELEYVHASKHYDEDNGIKFGRIQITNMSQPLEKQNWLEVKNGRNYSYEGYLQNITDNGIRRLKRVEVPFIVQEF